MTEMETWSHHAGKQQNGDSTAETWEAQDDETYKDKERPRPLMVEVWRNVILVSLLNIATVHYIFSMLGVIVGAHRLWSHRTFKASFPLRVFLAIANKYSETDADPYNTTRGFFFTHVGWLLVRKHPNVFEKGQKLDLSELKADKVVMFQRRHYMLSVVILCFLVPTLVPWYFWGESLVIGYFLSGLLRYVLLLNASWLVNSAAHRWGNRPYDKTINSAENPLVSISTLGGGFHNFHHTFPFDYASSEFGYRLNPATAFIDLMCFLGLAKDRKKVSKEVLIARMQRTGDSSHKSG